VVVGRKGTMRNEMMHHQKPVVANQKNVRQIRCKMVCGQNVVRYTNTSLRPPLVNCEEANGSSGVCLARSRDYF
jgi:hypothetical protein